MHTNTQGFNRYLQLRTHRNAKAKNLSSRELSSSNYCSVTHGRTHCEVVTVLLGAELELREEEHL
jgi:hypothetical protein